MTSSVSKMPQGFVPEIQSVEVRTKEAWSVDTTQGE